MSMGTAEQSSSQVYWSKMCCLIIEADDVHGNHRKYPWEQVLTRAFRLQPSLWLLTRQPAIF